jgi:hypothetical protein
MRRLCEQFPDVYPTGAQLRTLQRRVQLWRNEQVQRLIFESTGARVSGSDPAPVSQNVEATTIPAEVTSNLIVADQDGACLTTAGHSSDTVTATIPNYARQPKPIPRAAAGGEETGRLAELVRR